VVDLDTDFINIDNGSVYFYKRLENSIQKTEMIFKFDGKINTVLHQSEFDEDLLISELQNSSFYLDVSKIKEVKLTEFEKRIKEKSFIKSNWINYDLLRFYNETYFRLDEFTELHDENENLTFREGNRKLLNYIIVKLKQNKSIILFPKGLDRYYDIGFIFINNSDNSFTVSNSEFIDIEKSELKKEERFQILSLNPILNRLDLYFSFQNKKIVNAGTEIEAVSGKFDNAVVGIHFIVAKRARKLSIFNRELVDITPKDVRAAFETENYGGYLRALVNNKLMYINDKGEVLEKISSSFIDGVIDPSEPKINLKIENNNKDYFLSIFPNQDNFFWVIDSMQLSLKGLGRFEDVMFLYNNSHLKTETADQFFGSKKYLLTVKNSKFGLYDLKINYYDSTGQIPYELTELLPAEYDSIYQNLKFRKKGLYGIYGLNKGVRYTEINAIDQYFYKFKLPNGKKGWLDKTGNEYIDQ